MQTVFSQSMRQEEIFMQRCLDLAANGLGSVAPNPMVGCVIVHQGKIIGEGFHRHFGEAHAEVNAVNRVLDEFPPEILEQSQLFVSLEPCTHFGKTPPCADLIVSRKIGKVFIGTDDPNPAVKGKGIAKLIASGINVETGILADKCKELNRRFFTFHEKTRPYIILKWAQTADQFIAAKKISRENRWISNEFSRKLTHKWRSEEQAILIGSNTANIDNPSLTVRDWHGKNPLRIVIDPLQTLQAESRVLDGSAPTIIFTEGKSSQHHDTEWIQTDLDDMKLEGILDELHRRNILSVLVEGGTQTLQTFIDQQLWDEARIFISGKFMNDGVRAPQIDFSKEINREQILDDTLYTLRNN
jgi:diaminohydroxyphosphoribosylaminopyrimidine deaminase/5-amino-6-(5-phosphoribosylamino)uracil reductase